MQAGCAITVGGRKEEATCTRHGRRTLTGENTAPHLLTKKAVNGGYLLRWLVQDAFSAMGS